MKNLLLTFLITLSLNALSNDGYNKCTESIQVVAKQIQSIQQGQQQRFQGLCQGQPSYYTMCNIEAEVYSKIIQNLQQTMQLIQQHCADKYGQQQQQQQSQNQRNQPQQVAIEQNQIVNTGFNVLVLCDGNSIRHLNEIITTGNCVLPNGQAYQQPQSGACSYRSVYLEKGQNFIIGQQRYFCE